MFTRSVLFAFNPPGCSRPLSMSLSALACGSLFLLASACGDATSEEAAESWVLDAGPEDETDKSENAVDHASDDEGNVDENHQQGVEQEPISPEPVGRNPEDPNPVIADRITYPPRSFCTESIVDTRGAVLQRTTSDYDERGRLRLVRSDDHSLSYLYNSEGKLERIEDGDGCGTAFGYDGGLLVESRELCGDEREEGALLFKRWSYDEQDRLVRACSYSGDEPARLDETCTSFSYPTPLSQFEYGSREPVREALLVERHFHEDGRRKSIVHHSPAFGGPDHESVYTYDEDLRLIGLVSTRDQGLHYSFGYDEEGRIEAVAPFGPELTYEPSADIYTVPGSRALFEHDASGDVERMEFYDWQENFVGTLSLEGDACARDEMSWLLEVRLTLSVLDR